MRRGQQHRFGLDGRLQELAHDELTLRDEALRLIGQPAILQIAVIEQPLVVQLRVGDEVNLRRHRYESVANAIFGTARSAGRSPEEKLRPHDVPERARQRQR